MKKKKITRESKTEYAEFLLSMEQNDRDRLLTTAGGQNMPYMTDLIEKVLEDGNADTYIGNGKDRMDLSQCNQIALKGALNEISFDVKSVLNRDELKKFRKVRNGKL